MGGGGTDLQIIIITIIIVIIIMFFHCPSQLAGHKLCDVWALLAEGNALVMEAILAARAAMARVDRHDDYDDRSIDVGPRDNNAMQ